MGRASGSDGDFKTVRVETAVGGGGHGGENVGGGAFITSEFPYLKIFDQKIFVAGDDGVDVSVRVGFGDGVKVVFELHAYAQKPVVPLGG